MREVPALPTPEATESDMHRMSAHVDYITHHHHDPGFSEAPLTGQSNPHNSLAPPSSDATRASYVTSNSSNSRISRLSDFPSPPTQDFFTPSSVLQSYFDAPESSETQELPKRPLLLRARTASSAALNKPTNAI